MIIKYRSSAKFKATAEIVVVATILSTTLDSTSFRGYIHKYEISIDSFEKGTLGEKEFVVTYENLIVHRRGDIKIWPLKHGSGIEPDLKISERYRLYLRSAQDPKILLAEEIEKS